ncbi:MAG: Cell division protein FtsZ 1 [Methanomassiliicoccales archaeon PtaB.Bin134]|jgi:cell division protein FtsZ|nr:MAG: Cell division protein FtsZ 1 [Methanomassiliicoccales archaeon PtaB.Bin134]
MEAGMMEQTIRTEQMVSMLSRGLTEPKISVVGCGGAGNNIVNNIFGSCRKNVQTVAINTDERSLQKVNAHKKLLIGKDVTEGRGAEGFPEVGEYCAECAKDAIKDAIKDRDIVFVIAGMGGGTGTGTAPVVAQAAKDLNTITFVIAITPFSFETERMNKAQMGIDRIKKITKTTVVVENDRLLNIADEVPLNKAFSVIDNSVVKIIDSFCSQVSMSFMSALTEEVVQYMRGNEECPAVQSERYMMPELLVAAKGPSDMGLRPAGQFGPMMQ